MVNATVEDTHMIVLMMFATNVELFSSMMIHLENAKIVQSSLLAAVLEMEYSQYVDAKQDTRMMRVPKFATNVIQELTGIHFQ